MGTPYRLFVGRPSKQPPHTRQTDKIPRGKKKRGAQKNTSAAAVGSLERSEEQPSVRGVVDVLNVLGVLGRECHLPRFFGRRRGSRTGNSDRGPGTSPTLIGREFSSWEVLWRRLFFFGRVRVSSATAATSRRLRLWFGLWVDTDWTFLV